MAVPLCPRVYPLATGNLKAPLGGQHDSHSLLTPTARRNDSVLRALPAHGAFREHHGRSQPALRCPSWQSITWTGREVWPQASHSVLVPGSECPAACCPTSPEASPTVTTCSPASRAVTFGCSDVSEISTSSSLLSSNSQTRSSSDQGAGRPPRCGKEVIRTSRIARPRLLRETQMAPSLPGLGTLPVTPPEALPPAAAKTMAAPEEPWLTEQPTQLLIRELLLAMQEAEHPAADRVQSVILGSRNAECAYEAPSSLQKVAAWSARNMETGSGVSDLTVTQVCESDRQTLESLPSPSQAEPTLTGRALASASVPKGDVMEVLRELDAMERALVQERLSRAEIVTSYESMLKAKAESHGRDVAQLEEMLRQTLKETKKIQKEMASLTSNEGERCDVKMPRADKVEKSGTGFPKTSSLSVGSSSIADVPRSEDADRGHRLRSPSIASSTLAEIGSDAGPDSV